MSEGLRAGSVFATFAVKTDEWSKGINKAIKEVVEFSKKVEEVGSKIGQMGAVMAAGIAGAVAVASQVSAPMQAEMERLGELTTTLAAEIGDLFLPVVQAIADAVSRAVVAFQSMDPELKKTGASFAAWTTGALLGVGAIGKMSGYFAAVLKGAQLLGSGIGKAASLIGSAFTSAGLPILGIVAAVTAVILIAGALYKAWNDTSTGFKDSVLSIVKTLQGWGEKVAGFFRDMFSGVRDFMVRVAKGYLDLVAMQVRALAKLLKPVAEFLGMDGAADFLAKAENISGDKLLEGLQTGAQMLVDGAKKAATSIGDGIRYAVDGVKQMGSDLADKAKNALGLNAEGGPHIRKKLERPQVELGKAEVDPNAMFKGAGMDTSLVTTYGKQMIAQAKAVADAFAQSVKDARASIGSKIRNSFGQISSLIDTFEEGMLAGAGDPLTGIAAVMGSLLTQSQQFASLMQMVSGFLGFISDVLGTVLAPVLPTVGAIFNVVATLFQALTPILEGVLAPLAALAPIFALISQVVTALAPVLTLLSKLFSLITQPFQLLAGPITQGLFLAVKGVGLAFLWIARALGSAWNGIVGGIESVFRALGSIDLFGWKPLEFLNGWADGLQSAMVNTDALTSAMDTLSSTTLEQAQATANATVEQWKAADAARKVSESLSNVPSGYKVALARFSAESATTATSPTQRLAGTTYSVSPAHTWPSSASAYPSPAPAPALQPVTINDTVTIHVNGTTDPDEVARRVEAIQEARQQRRTGGRVRGDLRYAY